MKYIVLLLSIFAFSNVYSAQNRCGWLANPTPANISLIDRDGNWNISTQGGTSIDDDSMDHVFAVMKNENNFVRTNGNYGFTCACLKVDVKEHSIIKVYKAEQRLLKHCLEDVFIRDDIPLPFK